MEAACKFKSDIHLTWASRRANAKSILEMLTMAVPPGAELTIEADGADAETALDALEKLIRDSINVYEDV